MDGSVATGVSLRMRSELQRMYRTNSDSGNSALFDELLRVADSPKIELRDDTSSPSDSTSTDFCLYRKAMRLRRHATIDKVVHPRRMLKLKRNLNRNRRKPMLRCLLRLSSCSRHR